MSRPSARGKLVEAALETFQTRGFHGCSVQDIVDEAGVPKGSFYNHFKTKESLALETLSIYCAGSGLERLAEKKKAPLKRLRAHFEALAKGLQQKQFARGCLLGTFGAEVSDETPALRDALEEGFKKWSRAIAAVLREAQADQSLARAQEPERLARYVVNAWEGAVARARLLGSEKPLEEFFAVTFETLLG